MLSAEDQNQLMLIDYESLFRQSAFEIMSIRRIQSLSDTGCKFLSKMSLQCWKDLKNMYPKNYDDFAYDGLQILLKK